MTKKMEKVLKAVRGDKPVNTPAKGIRSVRKVSNVRLDEQDQRNQKTYKNLDENAKTSAKFNASSKSRSTQALPLATDNMKQQREKERQNKADGGNAYLNRRSQENL